MSKKSIRKFWFVIVTVIVSVCSILPAWADAAPYDFYDDAVLTDTYYEVAAPDGYVNMRSGPGTEFNIITPIYNGEILEANYAIATKMGGGLNWAQIVYKGEYGWVALSQVKLYKETKKEEKKYGEFDAEYEAQKQAQKQEEKRQEEEVKAQASVQASVEEKVEATVSAMSEAESKFEKEQPQEQEDRAESDISNSISDTNSQLLIVVVVAVLLLVGIAIALLVVMLKK